MPAPTSIPDFLDIIRKSGQVDPARLGGYLAGLGPDAPAARERTRCFGRSDPQLLSTTLPPHRAAARSAPVSGSRSIAFSDAPGPTFIA